MHFSVFWLSIALTHALRGVVDQPGSNDALSNDFANLDFIDNDSNNNNNNNNNNNDNPFSIPSHPGNDRLIAQAFSPAESFWHTAGAVTEWGLSGLMKSINWGGGAVAALAASVAALDGPDESTLTENEKYLKAEIAQVKSEGCGAARWGRVFCALGGVGPIIFPGLFEYVIDVYDINRGECVNPTVKPPSYCCASRQAVPSPMGNSDYIEYSEIGLYCIPLD